MSTLAIVVSLLALAVGGFALLTSRALRRAGAGDGGTYRKARHRFLSAYDGQTMPADLLVQTYEALSRRLASPAADLLPETRLARDLGLGPLDVEDAALLVAARCQGRVPTARDLDTLDVTVCTVDDFVRFLAPFCVVTGARRVAVVR